MFALNWFRIYRHIVHNCFFFLLFYFISFLFSHYIIEYNSWLSVFLLRNRDSFFFLSFVSKPLILFRVRYVETGKRNKMKRNKIIKCNVTRQRKATVGVWTISNSLIQLIASGIRQVKIITIVSNYLLTIEFSIDQLFN